MQDEAQTQNQTHIHAITHKQSQTHIHTNKHTYTQTNIHTHAHTHIHTHKQTYIHAHTHIQQTNQYTYTNKHTVNPQLSDPCLSVPSIIQNRIWIIL